MSEPDWVTIETVQGPARVQVHSPQDPTPAARTSRGTIVLGHGAGGGTGAKDLQSMLAACATGWTVVLVEQPWRVAGKKVATRPPTLDAAWRDIVPALLGTQSHAEGRGRGSAGGHPGAPLPRPLVVGGRSAGARVACRTSPGDPEVGLPRADGVLCLAFPLHPPGKAERSRVAELLTPVDLGIPTLVVQGATDPFGSLAEFPAAGGSLELVEVPGNHSPSRDQELVTRSVLDWLDRLG